MNIVTFDIIIYILSILSLFIIGIIDKLIINVELNFENKNAIFLQM
jgi:hypothetical protein